MPIEAKERIEKELFQNWNEYKELWQMFKEVDRKRTKVIKFLEVLGIH